MANTTPELDSFTRGDSGTVGGNFTEGGVFGNTNTVMSIIGNAIGIISAGFVTYIYYNTGTFGPDSEVFVTVNTVPATDDWIGLFVRCSLSPTNGYAIEIYNDAGSQDLYIFRVTGNAYTQLGAVVTTTLAAGDGLLFRALGTSLQVEHRVSGVWTTIATRTDSTYSGAGYIGTYIQDTVARLDNFGGGTYVPPAAGQSLVYRPRSRRVLNGVIR